MQARPGILSASLGKRLGQLYLYFNVSTYYDPRVVGLAYSGPRRARLGPSRPTSSRRARRTRRARNLVCELNELLARQLKIELTCASGTTSTYNCIQQSQYPPKIKLNRKYRKNNIKKLPPSPKTKHKNRLRISNQCFG